MATQSSVVRGQLAQMPDGPIVGADAWRADRMRESGEWLVHLDAADIAEIDTAIQHADVDDRPIATITRDDFPLRALRAKLEAIREQVLNGRGFVLLRGLPVDRYSIRHSALAYWGIGMHLGHAVPQNAMGHLLGHVIDVGRTTADFSARTYQTNSRQYFHADSSDIVGLLCLRKAKRGGLSAIVSSVTVYNEMLARSPQLTAELFKPIHIDRRGEVPKGKDPWYLTPIFNWHEGKLSTHYARRYIESIRRLDEVPPITDVQRAAFDLFDEIVEDPGVQLRMEFEPGDIQLLHNPQILHDRTEFEDWDDADQRRHLLRLWLCTPSGRALPPAYAERWGSIDVGNRGGVVVHNSIPHAPLEP
ncbi:MAG: hypothetical protein ACI8W7_001346 [Gammaproteobacteria bacterium]|jgi:hypothetical protein